MAKAGTALGVLTKAQHQEGRMEAAGGGWGGEAVSDLYWYDLGGNQLIYATNLTSFIVIFAQISFLNWNHVLWFKAVGYIKKKVN